MPEKEKKKRVEVVMNLPTTNYRTYNDNETGEEVTIKTFEEAITEIYNDIKQIRKQIG